MLLGKYSILLWRREFPYILVRNWLFVGIPYFSIGMMLKEKVNARRLSLQWLTVLTVLFSVTTMAERCFLVSIDANTTRDHYISSTFLAVTVFLLFLCLYQERQPEKLEMKMAMVGRRYSTWIYIIHPIFIKILAFVMRKVGLYGIYRYVAPMVIYAWSIVFVATVSMMAEHTRIFRR